MRRVLVLALLVCLAAGANGADPLRTLAVGAERPRLDFRLLDGGNAPEWKELRGKVVVLDFWATWCAPCVASIPHVNALRKTFAEEDVRFFSITYEPAGKARAFLDKHPIETAVGIDNDLTTFESFLAWGIPMAYVLDREGKVAAVVNPMKLTEEVIRSVLAGRIPDVEQHPGWSDPAGAAKYFRAQLEEDRKKYGR